MMQMMLKINSTVHYNQANSIQMFRMHITNIGRGIYLTEIRILPNLNRQYHSQIFQRPVSE